MRREAPQFAPKQEAFARELKDRWLEEVLAQPALLAPGREKYAVRRQIAPGMGATKPMEPLPSRPEVVAEVVDGSPGVRRLDAA